MPDFLESPRFPGCPSFGFTSRSRVPRRDHAPGLGRGEAQPRVGVSAGASSRVTVGPRAGGRDPGAARVLARGRRLAPLASASRTTPTSSPARCSSTPTATDQPLVEIPTRPASTSWSSAISSAIARRRTAPIYKPVVGHRPAVRWRHGRLHHWPRHGRRRRNVGRRVRRAVSLRRRPSRWRSSTSASRSVTFALQELRMNGASRDENHPGRLSTTRSHRRCRCAGS